MKLNFNTSLAKGFFKEVGIRSSLEAIERFKVLVIAEGIKIANAAKNNAESRNRKTVDVQDLENVTSTLVVKSSTIDDDNDIDDELVDEDDEDDEDVVDDDEFEEDY